MKWTSTYSNPTVKRLRLPSLPYTACTCVLQIFTKQNNFPFIIRHQKTSADVFLLLTHLESFPHGPDSRRPLHPFTRFSSLPIRDSLMRRRSFLLRQAKQYFFPETAERRFLLEHSWQHRSGNDTSCCTLRLAL